MKVAFVADPASPNGWYRAIGPLLALERRGVELRQVWRVDGSFHPELIEGCDVLHVHRQHDDRTTRLAHYANRAGIGLVWDNDDDLSSVPAGKTSANRRYGGLRGARAQQEIQRMVQLADVVTTPSAVLAELFAGYGAADARVIENHVRDESAELRPHAGGDEVVVGWMGGQEHRYDADRLPLRAALGQLLEHHAHVRVVTIGGVALGLSHERYRHVPRVRFDELDGELAQFDVGLAPLVDIALNRARSNVKLKEYAVVGVPWLASPIGPYVGHGEREGGRLVQEDEWLPAIERLLGKPRERRRLAKRARKWGEQQTISRNVDSWRAVYAEACARAQQRVAAAGAGQAGAGSAAR